MAQILNRTSMVDYRVDSETLPHQATAVTNSATGSGTTDLTALGDLIRELRAELHEGTRPDQCIARLDQAIETYRAAGSTETTDQALAWNSFDTAKQALVEYAEALDHVQEMANRAATDAAVAEAERSTATGRRDAADEEHTWYQSQLRTATETLTSTKVEMTTLALLPDPIRAALLDQRCRTESARCAQLMAKAHFAGGQHQRAQQDVAIAEARLAAANRLGETARELRESTTMIAAHRLNAVYEYLSGPDPKTRQSPNGQETR